jgi:hypothetical protein
MCFFKTSRFKILHAELRYKNQKNITDDKTTQIQECCVRTCNKKPELNVHPVHTFLQRPAFQNKSNQRVWMRLHSTEKAIFIIIYSKRSFYTELLSSRITEKDILTSFVMPTS